MGKQTNKLKAAMFILSCGFILASCRSQRPGPSQITAKVVVPVDTTVQSKPAVVDVKFNCDSLKYKYDSLAALSTDTVFIRDTIREPGKPQKIQERKGVLIYSDSVADVYYSVNATGELAFKVKVKPQNIQVKFDQEAEVKIDCPGCPECPDPSFWDLLKKYFWTYLVVLIVGLGAVLILGRRP